ncbi:MAG: flagellar type III secretion system protein FliR [Gammaproteobacteria bacterium]|nr:MAG: flagellar type III secretion system protein FliR [Gammaproteobacteria bacterium]
MWEVSDAQIGQFVGQHLWPLFRIASFLMVMPVIGTQIVSPRVRLVLALLITVVVAPQIKDVPALDPLSWPSLAIVVEQIFVGVAMGFCLLLLFQLFVVAGQAIAMQMGLGFASMVDPANGISVAALGQFYLMLVTLLFLSMNGHLVAFEVIIDSFEVLPIGAGGISQGGWGLIAGRMSWLFAGALMIALPAVTALLLVNISFGVMTRAAPQMNIFSIGFPVSVVLGLLFFWIGTADFLPGFQRLTEDTLGFMRTILDTP